MAAVLEVADVFRRHGEAFRQARAGHLGRVERRVMGAITACRTAALGGHVEQCDDCGATRIAYNPALTSFPYLSAREGAAGQAVVCPLLRGISPTRWVAPKQHRTTFSLPHAREGADGQAVVCPLLRGSSATRGVAPKQPRVPAFTPFITL